MRKWEYTAVRLSDDPVGLTDQLNQLGDIGWELVATWEQSDGCQLGIFKRPAPGLPQC